MGQNHKKITRLNFQSEVLLFAKNRYYVQNAKDGIQIHVYKIHRESVTCSSQSISVEAKQILRKPRPQFREQSGKVRLRQHDGSLIKR